MRLLKLGLLCSFTTACTLAGPHPVACETSLDCRENFGSTSVCLDSGVCGQASPVAGCTEPEPHDLFTDAESYRDAIVLGSTYRGGEGASLEQVSRLAIRLANEQGGLNGRPVALAMCDLDGASHEDAVSWLEGQLNLPAVIGTGTEEDAVELASTLGGTLYLSASAKSPAYEQADPGAGTAESPGLRWSVAAPVHLEATAITGALADRGAGALALLVENNSSSLALADAIATSWTGGTERWDFDGTSELNTSLAQIASTPESTTVLLLAETPHHASDALNTAAVLGGFASRGWFMSAGLAEPSWLPEASASSELFPNVRGVRAPDLDTRLVYQHLTSSMQAAFGAASGGPAVARAWDANWLGLFAATWAQHRDDGVTAAGMALGLRHLGQGPELPLHEQGWVDAQERLLEQDFVDVIGASSDLSYGDDEAIDLSYAVWAIDTNGTDFEAAP